MEKGIIALPLTVTDNPLGGVNFKAGLSSEALNQYLLYWDKIVLPTNNLIHVRVSPFEDELIKQKIIFRPRLELRELGGDLGAAPLINGQLAIAQHYLSQEPGKWVLAQHGEQNFFPDEVSESRNQLSLALSNVLPTPPSDTPIEEILQFKLARKSELDAMWYHLDQLCLQMQREPDRALAQRLITQDFAKSVEESMKVTAEKWSYFHLSDFKVNLSFDYKSIVTGVATGGAMSFANSGSLTTVFATVFGVALSSFKVSADIKKAPKLQDKSEKNKLSYLSSVNRDLIRLR